jgi:hypothetical protein
MGFQIITERQKASRKVNCLKTSAKSMMQSAPIFAKKPCCSTLQSEFFTNNLCGDARTMNMNPLRRSPLRVLVREHGIMIIALYHSPLNVWTDTRETEAINACDVANREFFYANLKREKLQAEFGIACFTASREDLLKLMTKDQVDRLTDAERDYARKRAAMDTRKSSFKARFPHLHGDFPGLPDAKNDEGVLKTLLEHEYYCAEWHLKFQWDDIDNRLEVRKGKMKQRNDRIRSFNNKKESVLEKMGKLEALIPSSNATGYPVRSTVLTDLLEKVPSLSKA